MRAPLPLCLCHWVSVNSPHSLIGRMLVRFKGVKLLRTIGQMERLIRKRSVWAIMVLKALRRAIELKQEKTSTTATTKPFTGKRV